MCAMIRTYAYQMEKREQKNWEESAWQREEKNHSSQVWHAVPVVYIVITAFVVTMYQWVYCRHTQRHTHLYVSVCLYEHGLTLFRFHSLHFTVLYFSIIWNVALCRCSSLIVIPIQYISTYTFIRILFRLFSNFRDFVYFYFRLLFLSHVSSNNNLF